MENMLMQVACESCSEIFLENELLKIDGIQHCPECGSSHLIDL